MSSEQIEEYDVIIIGSGAGGGIAAGVLAEAGKRVLLLERGRKMTHADDPLDHLRNHRFPLYGQQTGPENDGNPRVAISASGVRSVVRPNEGPYQNNAVCVGGGTLVYGAQAWRFMPQDFRMAEIYGVPEGSSLADWPIGYDDMEPWYDRAEWEMGVCGDANNKFAGPRRRGYPMPAVPGNPQRELLLSGANKLGWSTFAVPLLINTTTYNGRRACIQCGNCVGHACPSDAKTGTQNTMVPRALASENCTLVTQAMVRCIDTDLRGKVIGVSYVADADSAPKHRSARAKIVVVAAAAIESARLLLNSTSSQHPKGLGNHSDQVGRNLQGHYYPAAYGTFKEDTCDNLGPGVSIATCQFNHGNKGIIGGAMMANDFIRTPIIYQRRYVPSDVPKWGLANKRYMRDWYHHSFHIAGPVQEIPSPDGRVTIDPSVRDKWGIPVVRLSGTQHAETQRTSDFMLAKQVEWLRAAGAIDVKTMPSSLHLSGFQHQAGTCRMGNDPKNSVTDSFGRVHGHDNLFVTDGSTHVTNGGFNPVLTIMALAFRAADHIAKL